MIVAGSGNNHNALSHEFCQLVRELSIRYGRGVANTRKTE